MLQQNSLIPVDRVELVHTGRTHPFHAANRQASAENWLNETRALPALFDGPVMLASSVAIEGGVLSAECHIVPYSTFLLWRRSPPAKGALHIFAMALPVGSDGGVLAGRMAGHTANAGVVYCASGSFDRDDIVDGRFDADRNMRREVAEETGLDLREAEAEPGYRILAMDRHVVIVRVHRFARTAAELVGRVERHIAAQAESELSEALAITAADEVTSQFGSHMRPVLEWQFSRS